MKKVKQYPYWEWEDYLNGMYEIPKERDYLKFSHKAIKLLSDPPYFEEVAYDVIYEWVKITDMVMHNSSMNKVAWLGQASCCYEFRVPELVTRIGWKSLTEGEKVRANNIARKVIAYYEKKYY